MTFADFLDKLYAAAWVLCGALVIAAVLLLMFGGR